jgi:hypothetical protein
MPVDDWKTLGCFISRRRGVSCSGMSKLRSGIRSWLVTGVRPRCISSPMMFGFLEARRKGRVVTLVRSLGA